MSGSTEIRDLGFGDDDVAYCIEGEWSSISAPSFQWPVRIVWERRGIGVAVMSRPTDMLVFVALATATRPPASAMPRFRFEPDVVPLLARRCREADLERWIPHYIRTASRLLELRDGGWRMRSEERVSASDRDWEYRFELIDPNDDRIHLRLPGTVMLRPWRRSRRALTALERLDRMPDEPGGARTGQSARRERLAVPSPEALDAERRTELIRELRASDEPVDVIVTRVLADSLREDAERE